MIYFLYDPAVNGLYTLLFLQQKFPVHISLFKGTKDETLVDVAPHLFKAEDNTEDWADSELSLKEIIVIESPAQLNELALHLKEFIYQRFEGRECYFRFWDARVLKKFISTSSPAQLRVFFGPVDSFTIGDMEAAIQFSFNAYNLVSKEGKTQELSPLLYRFSKTALTQATP